MLRTPATLAAILLSALPACSGRREDRVRAVDSATVLYPMWLRQAGAAPPGADFQDLWMRSDGTEGWAVGSRNTILHYAENHWAPDTIPGDSTTTWKSVAFDQTGRFGFAVGSNGCIARYAGRHRWTLLAGPIADTLTSIWMDRGGLQGFAVGYPGVVLQLQDGQWRAVHPAPAPPTGRLKDVAANDRELWVRDSALTLVYSRPDLNLVRRIDEFGAMALWQQPNAGAIWIAGVQQQVKDGKIKPPVDGSGFTVRQYDGENAQDYPGIEHAVWTAWMAPSHSCGLGAGGIPAEAGYWPLSMYITRTRTFFFENPDSAIIRSVWVNDSCTAGWGVGAAGFMGRWQMATWKVGPLRWPEGNLANLSGHFALAVDSGQAGVTLDSMRLLGEAPLKLDSVEHFTASRTPREIEFTLTPLARKQASGLFHQKEVNLRFFLTFRTGADTFHVAYEKEAPFEFEPAQGLDKVPVWLWTALGGLLLLIGFVYARRKPILGAIIHAFKAGEMFGGVPYQLSRVLVRHNDSIRRGVFAPYFDKARSEYPTDTGYMPPALQIHRCSWLATGTLPPRSRALIEHLHRELSKQARHPVLWIEDPKGEHGRALLASWVGVAIEQGGIPVPVELSRSKTIREKVVEAFESLGDFEPGVASEIEFRKLVFLLDGTKGIKEPEQTDQFIETHRRRNLIVICASVPPTLDDVCHLVVQ